MSSLEGNDSASVNWQTRHKEGAFRKEPYFNEGWGNLLEENIIINTDVGRGTECLTRLGSSLAFNHWVFIRNPWWTASPCPRDESAGKASMSFFLLQGQPHHKMPAFYGSWLQCWLRLEAEFLFQPEDVCQQILDPGHDFWLKLCLEWQVGSIIKRSPRLVYFLTQDELFLLLTKRVKPVIDLLWKKYCSSQCFLVHIGVWKKLSDLKWTESATRKPFISRPLFTQRSHLVILKSLSGG